MDKCSDKSCRKKTRLSAETKDEEQVQQHQQSRHSVSHDRQKPQLRFPVRNHPNPPLYTKQPTVKEKKKEECPDCLREQERKLRKQQKRLQEKQSQEEELQKILSKQQQSQKSLSKEQKSQENQSCPFIKKHASKSHHQHDCTPKLSFMSEAQPSHRHKTSSKSHDICTAKPSSRSEPQPSYKHRPACCKSPNCRNRSAQLLFLEPNFFDTASDCEMFYDCASDLESSINNKIKNSLNHKVSNIINNENQKCINEMRKCVLQNLDDPNTFRGALKQVACAAQNLFQNFETAYCDCEKCLCEPNMRTAEIEIRASICNEEMLAPFKLCIDPCTLRIPLNIQMQSPCRSYKRSHSCDSLMPPASQQMIKCTCNEATKCMESMTKSVVPRNRQTSTPCDLPQEKPSHSCCSMKPPPRSKQIIQCTCNESNATNFMDPRCSSIIPRNRKRSLPCCNEETQCCLPQEKPTHSAHSLMPPPRSQQMIKSACNISNATNFMDPISSTIISCSRPMSVPSFKKKSPCDLPPEKPTNSCHCVMPPPKPLQMKKSTCNISNATNYMDPISSTIISCHRPLSAPCLNEKKPRDLPQEKPPDSCCSAMPPTRSQQKIRNTCNVPKGTNFLEPTRSLTDPIIRRLPRPISDEELPCNSKQQKAACCADMPYSKPGKKEQIRECRDIGTGDRNLISKESSLSTCICITSYLQSRGPTPPPPEEEDDDDCCCTAPELFPILSEYYSLDSIFNKTAVLVKPESSFEPLSYQKVSLPPPLAAIPLPAPALPAIPLQPSPLSPIRLPKVDSLPIPPPKPPKKTYRLAYPQHKDLSLCAICRFDPSPLIDETGRVVCPGKCGCCLCPWMARPTLSQEDQLNHAKIKVCKCREKGTIFTDFRRPRQMEEHCSQTSFYDLCPCRDKAEGKYLELFGHEMWTDDQQLREPFQGKQVSLSECVELFKPRIM